MYCDYWNLTKPPFDNVPDASMYVDCHESMENVISETIFAIKEGNECLTVIVGEVGLGKTLSLRVIIDSLEPDKYKVALITNPALSFVQLLREIIGQITGKQCEVKNKVDLQEIFNRLLFETADQGKKIVIVIDEANVLSSSNLDDLRLLTNMQDDERNLFTLLLVGQMEFARTLEHPKRANLFQRIGTYGHIEKLPSEEAVKTYIESRLRIAGSQRMLFSDDAIPVIWEFSEHGVPRLINKLCKLCLKAGETNEFEIISGDIASQIADRFQKLSKTSLQKRKPQSLSDAEPAAKDASIESKAKARTSVPKKEVPQVKAPARPTPPPQMEEAIPVQPRMARPQPPARPIPPPQMEEEIPVQPRMAMPEPPPVRPTPPPQMEEEIPAQPRMATPEPPPIRPTPPPQMEEEIPAQPRMAMPEPPPVRPTPPPQMEEEIPVQPRMARPQQPVRPTPPPQMEEEIPAQSRMATPEPPPVRPVGPPPMEEAIPIQHRMARPQQPPVRPVEPPPIEEAIPIQHRMARPQQPPMRPVGPPPIEEAIPIQHRMARPQQPPMRPVGPPPLKEAMPIQPKAAPLAKPSGNVVPLPGAPPVKTPAAPIPSQRETQPFEPEQKETIEQPTYAEEEIYEEVMIGQQKIKLAIPAHVIKQAQSASSENKNKLAGYWSAQILKGHPNIMHSSMADPVAMWFEVKSVILKRFNSSSTTSSAM